MLNGVISEPGYGSEKQGKEREFVTTDELPNHNHTYDRLPKTFANTSFDQDDQANFEPAVRKASNSEIANTANVGGDQPHNNIQPSTAAYCWRRTA